MYRWRGVVAAEQHCPQEADLDFKLQRLNSPSVLYVSACLVPDDSLPEVPCITSPVNAEPNG